MKSASEWVKDSEGTWDADYVRAIQANAIEYIARMIGDDRKMNRFPTDAMAIMEEARKLREWNAK